MKKKVSKKRITKEEIQKCDSIDYVTKVAHQINNKKGFNDGWENSLNQIIGKLYLIHSEISEAGEEVRDNRLDIWYREKDGKPEGYPTELADAYIRIVTLAKLSKVDLKRAIAEKLEFNKDRPLNHGRVAKI